MQENRTPNQAELDVAVESAWSAYNPLAYLLDDLDGGNVSLAPTDVGRLCPALADAEAGGLTIARLAREALERVLVEAADRAAGLAA